MFRDIVRKHELDGLGSCACAAPSVGVGGWGRGGGTYYLVRLESLSYPCISSQDIQNTGPEGGGQGGPQRK